MLLFIYLSRTNLVSLTFFWSLLWLVCGHRCNQADLVMPKRWQFDWISLYRSRCNKHCRLCSGALDSEFKSSPRQLCPSSCFRVNKYRTSPRFCDGGTVVASVPSSCIFWQGHLRWPLLQIASALLVPWMLLLAWDMVEIYVHSWLLVFSWKDLRSVLWM